MGSGEEAAPAEGKAPEGEQAAPERAYEYIVDEPVKPKENKFFTEDKAKVSNLTVGL